MKRLNSLKEAWRPSGPCPNPQRPNVLIHQGGKLLVSVLIPLIRGCSCGIDVTVLRSGMEVVAFCCGALE